MGAHQVSTGRSTSRYYRVHAQLRTVCPTPLSSVNRMEARFHRTHSANAKISRIPSVTEPFSDRTVILSRFAFQRTAEYWTTTAGKYWLYSNMSDTHYNHNGVPNDPRPSCNANIANDNGFGLHPPKSFHYACVNVLFGDGHVRPDP